MSVRPHPSRDGWYVVDYYPDGRNGKRIREPVKGYSEAVAFEQALSKHKTAPAAVTHPRIKDVAAEYLVWCTNEKQSPVTIAQKVRRLEMFILPALGIYRVKDLNQNILDHYSQTVAFWTYQTDLSILGSIIKWMIKRGYSQPLHFQPERRKGNHGVKPVPHPSDLIPAIEAIPVERQRILFKLMLFTGLRWNEARNLRWEDVDINSMTVSVKEVENAEQDIIYIPHPLQSWFEINRIAAGFVFYGRPKGKPYGVLWKVLKTLSAACGVHVTNHTFRHASGTYLYESTRDLYQVQAHLRHKEIKTSAIYARMSVARRKSAVGSVVDYVVTHT